MFRQSSPVAVRQIPVSLEPFGPRAPRPFGLRSALALAVLLVLPVAAQTPGPGPAPPQGYHPQRNQLGPDSSDSGVGMTSHMESKRFALLNQMRQKSMVSDAEKLVRLAQELNDDANGATPLQAAERVRKTVEIEKLAKEVKEKMTYAIGASPDINSPFATFRP